MDKTDFRAMLEQLPLVVYSAALDERSTALYVSPQIERLLGYTADEWQADPDLYVRSLHPDDSERVLVQLALRNRGETGTTSNDYRLLARDGSTVWVRDDQVVVRDADGVPTHSEGYLQDVTARRQESGRLELLVGVLETAMAGAGPNEVTSAVVEHLGARYTDLRMTYSTISGSSLECRYASDGDESRAEHHDTDLSEWYRETLGRGEAVVVSDVLNDPRVTDPDWLIERRIRAYVDAPVRAGDEVGVLSFNSAERRRWSDREIRTFSEVADQLAVVLSDARSRAERHRVERELGRREAILEAVTLGAAQLLAEPDWRAVAPTLLERLGIAVGASRAYLFENELGVDGGLVANQRFEWTGQGIEPQLGNELLQKMSYAEAGLERFERTVGADEVFSAVVSRLTETERAHFAAQGIQSLIVVPIMVDGTWWGFLGFDDCERERAWTVTESETFRLAASLVAAAIQRRDSEATLREQEQKLRAVFETSLDAVLVLDDERRFGDVNPAACELFGAARADLLGRTLDDYVPADRLVTLDARWAEHRLDESLIENRLIQRSDGAIRQVEGSIRPDFLPGLHILYLRDVTERKKLEAELLGALKLESIGRLAGGVAHDFNNLLTAITGYTSLLLDRTNGDGELAHDLGEIRRAADRAAELTTQLLAFGRRQVLQPRTLDLNEVLRETGSLLRRLLGEHVVLELRPAPVLGAVRVDPGQIEQVIVNLAVNARDAMPAGGRLTISTRELRLDAGTEIELEVTDTGIGMDEPTQTQIFDPFFTTRADGTGLGLATVHGIVSQSGGTIAVESRPAEGSTFRIRLPRVGEVAQAPPPDPEPEPLDEGGTETILLVEDEDIVRSLTQRVLERCGYTVLAYANGAEAVELAEEDSRQIDLLLTDVVMPGLRGPEVAARIAATRPSIKVLYMSGYADEALLGAAAFDESALIEKPFAVRALARRVREALESHAVAGR